MNLLLDTHVFLWLREESPRLTNSTRDELASSRNELWVSVISLWELSMKSKSGKLRIPPDFFSTINREDFRILPFEMNHALEAGNLPLHHKDPFDRALIGQAKCERFRLVTADRTLVAYKNEIEIFEVW